MIAAEEVPRIGSSDDARENGWRGPLALILAFAAAKLALHLLTNNGYGIFRDELYFIVCGRRLDWGYVDHPPVVPLLARMGTALFGETQFGVRFFAAITGAATVALTGLTVRELGGRAMAIALACTALLAAPVYLGAQSLLSTAGVEPLWWTACALLLARMIRLGQPQLWPWFGLAAGLGLQTKHSTVFFGFALMLALALTPQRRLFLSRWFLLGAAVAAAVFLPNLIWEARHDWATLELLSNVKNSAKNVVLGPVDFFLQQILLMHPLAFPLWLGGLGWLLLGREARSRRVLGIAYCIAFAVMVALKAKNYYLMGAYPMLLAAGAVAFERFTARPRRAWMAPAYLALLIIGGAALAPVTLPILAPERLLAYQKAIGIEPPRTERSHTAALQQGFADCFGWQEMAASVADVWNSLSDEERSRTAIFVQNYGEAGALDVYGKPLGLPPVLSGHQSYFLWGTHGFREDMLLVMDDQPGSLPELCSSVEDKGAVRSSPWAMPWEQQQRLFLCRGLKQPLESIWPKTKNWM